MLDKHCHGDHPEHPLISFKTLLKEIDISLDALNYSGEHRTRIRKQLVKEHKSVNTPVDFKYFPSTTGQNFQHGEALAQDNTQPVPPQNAAHIQAGKLQRGDWVDIKRAEPNQFHRAKLQWVSADRQQYSFIKLHGHRSYRYTLPELDHAVSDHESYVRLIATKTREELVAEFVKGTQMGADISSKDYAAIVAFAKQIHLQYVYRQELLVYMESILKEHMPNVTLLLGPTLAARLLAGAGSLKRLAAFPASTLQLLGAEKALFRHLKTGARSPKYGHIFNHQLLQQ